MSPIRRADRILDAAENLSSRVDYLSEQRQAEKCFYRGIRDELLSGGIRAACDVSYPIKRKKLDLQVDFEDGTLAIEAKVLFTDWWSRQSCPSRVASRLLYPLQKYGYEDTHSAAMDLQKLTSFQSSQLSDVGILIVSSETDQFNSTQLFETFEQLAVINDDPWSRRRRRFANPFWKRDGFWLSLGIWTCPAGALSAWWATAKSAFLESPSRRPL